MLRSQLKKDMYVRMPSEISEDFWSRIGIGRYFRVTRPATEPDDATSWRQTGGDYIMYGMNYMMQESNSDMNAVTPEEQQKLEEIFADYLQNRHKSQYYDLFKLGKKINRLMEQIEDLCDDLASDGRSPSLWDQDSFSRLIDELCISKDKAEEYAEEINEVKEHWEELEKALDELTLLEDKFVRGK